MFQVMKLTMNKLMEWWQEVPMIARDWILGVTVVVVLGAAGAGGWFLLKSPYRNWQQTRAVERGREAAAAGDYTKALLAFRRATQLRPDSVDTWREVAEFLSKLGSPEALVARQNLVRLEPEDVSYRMALVSESLTRGDMVLARRELTELEKRAVEDASFYRLAAALALALGRQADLQGHLESLVGLEPDNAGARFNLAALRLWGEDGRAAESAARELEALMANEEWAVRAALELLKQAAATRDPVVADAAVARVLRRLDPAGADEALGRREPGEPPGWGALMVAVKAKAAVRPADAAALAEWWSRLGDRPAVIAWLDGLMPDVVRAAPVRAVLAGLVASEGMSERLDGLLAAGAWGPIRRDVLTLALAARWQARLAEGGRSDATWADAVQAASADAGALRVLVRLGAVWRRPGWQIEALWPLVSNHRGEHWALEALRGSLALRRDDAGLLRLYEIWATRTLDSSSVQGTRVMLAALLDRMNVSADDAKRRLEAGPADEPVVRLALAAAYWRSGDTERARATLRGLNPDLQGLPKVKLWRGLVAAKADARAEARELLVTLDDRDWLPSERKLRAEALEELRQRDRRDAEAARKAGTTGS